MACYKIIKTNWHTANCSIIKKQRCCKCPKNCTNATEILLEYVFKQQIHYVRCVDDDMILNWIPILQSDGIPYINLNNNSFYSSNLVSNLLQAIPATAVPVVYPDYSKVDVGEGINWPAKVFAPYVDATAWPPYSLSATYMNYKVPYFNLGFIVSLNYDVCQPSWGSYYSTELGPLNDDIKMLRALGGDICVSIGGAANEPIHLLAPDVSSLFKQYQLFCDAYKLTRIDFDIEGAWVSTAYNAENMNNSIALKMLQDYYISTGRTLQICFTLPILPTGLTSDGLNVVQLAVNAGVNITVINAMTMDYGDGAAPNPSGKMGQYGIQAITALKNQLNTIYKGTKTDAELWAMIGTTPMLGVNDISTEIFTQSDAMQTLTFAQSNNIGMISMWSSNRDAYGTSSTGIPQSPYDFTTIFNVYNS